LIPKDLSCFLLRQARYPDGSKRSADNIRAAGLFRRIHHNRALSAERTGLPSRVEHCVVVRRRAHDAGDPTAPSASADPGLVPVRGSDRPGLRDERKGWTMSVKLTDAQLVMMSAAAQREDRCLAAPETMKGAALSKAGTKLMKLGVAREIHAKPGAPIWRCDEAGSAFTLKLTAAGLKAMAGDAESEEPIKPGEASQPQLVPEANTGVSLDDVGRRSPTAAPRDGSKLALTIDLLRRADGASIDDLTQATGWLAHTTRAAITRLRKRGYVVTRERTAAGESVYRISGAPGGSGDRMAVQTETAEGRRDPKPKTKRAA
jgi:hypothetical protein